MSHRQNQTTGPFLLNLLPFWNNRTGWDRAREETVEGNDFSWTHFTGHVFIKGFKKAWRRHHRRVLWSRFIIPLDDERSYLFITFVLCLRWVGTCQPHLSLLVIVCHTSLFFSPSHPCLVIFVRLMVSVASEGSRPRRVEWDLFWFRCLCSSICIHLLCVGVSGFVRQRKGEEQIVWRDLHRFLCVKYVPHLSGSPRADYLSNILMKWFHWNKAFSH